MSPFPTSMAQAVFAGFGLITAAFIGMLGSWRVARINAYATHEATVNSQVSEFIKSQNQFATNVNSRLVQVETQLEDEKRFRRAAEIAEREANERAEAAEQRAAGAESKAVKLEAKVSTLERKVRALEGQLKKLNIVPMTIDAEQEVGQ